MKLIINLIVAVFAMLCAGCAALAKDPTPTELCLRIQEFSKGIEIGSSRNIILSTVQGSDAFPTKFCKPSSMDGRSRDLCEWMSVNMSAEFMGQNIGRVIACITNSKGLFGKDIQVNELTGRFTISEPFKDAKNIDVDFAFHFKSDVGNLRNYFSITVRGVDNAEQ